MLTSIDLLNRAYTCTHTFHILHVNSKPISYHSLLMLSSFAIVEFTHKKPNKISKITNLTENPKIYQASTLTFVRLSGTSENWRRTSRSCITIIRRNKWKNQRFPNVPVRRTNPVNIIYFNRYKILGLLYKRALFDLQFVHNLFWLKLKWNARSKLFYCIIYHSPCFDEVQGHWQN
jgi:hypothetical protein